MTGLPRGARALNADFGGTGRPTCEQLRAGADVTGIDVSEAIVSVLKRPGEAPNEGLYGMYLPPRYTRQAFPRHRTERAGLTVREVEIRPGTSSRSARPTSFRITPGARPES